MTAIEQTARDVERAGADGRGGSSGGLLEQAAKKEPSYARLSAGGAEAGS